LYNRCGVSIPMAPIGKSLVFAGIAIIVVGLALWGLSSVPYVGKLPGDVYVRRGSFTFYFPLATCILISIAATLLFSLMRR
jgi:Protein of unknown function (DUF2905)